MISLELSEKPRKPVIMDVREDKLIKRVALRGERKREREELNDVVMLESWRCCSMLETSIDARSHRGRNENAGMQVFPAIRATSLCRSLKLHHLSFAGDTSLSLSLSHTHSCLLKLVHSKDETRRPDTTTARTTRKRKPQEKKTTSKENHKKTKHKTRQDMLRQDKTRQERTGQNKTRQENKTRQDKTPQDKTRQKMTRQDMTTTRQDKTKQEQTRQDKTKRNETKQTKQEMTRHDKTKQDRLELGVRVGVR
jgi:hypothetical protein